MTISTSEGSPAAARVRALTALAEHSFDLVIIGGGITGAGIARDAALRGLTVALVDKGDFASGTSSKSTKLVHGGLRYLEQGHVGLVFESVHERALLLKLAPHIVRAQEFLTPSYGGDRPGLFIMDCGLWLYDALSGFTSPKLHRTYRRAHIEELEPGLRKEKLRGGIVYYDCATDDARLTIENIVDARSLGAVALNHVRATKLLKEGERFVGVEVQDVRSAHAPVAVRGKVVINATGPWCDEVRGMYGATRILGPTKGVHIVVDSKKFPLGRALLVREKKRVVFFIPWGARSVIGTTDTFYDGSPDEVYAHRGDVDYLLDVANHYFPDTKLKLPDVLATWAGLRPLLRPADSAEASAVSREHHLESLPGLVTIAGGKLTTYRRMAAEVVDLAITQLEKKIPTSTTDQRALPGGVGVDGMAGIDGIAVRLGNHVPEDVAKHLARTYGARARSIEARVIAEPALAERLEAELPFVMAEVDEAVDVEQAAALSDLLERRVPLSLHGRDQGLDVAERVAQRMAKRLGWSDDERAREVTDYRAAIALTRKFRG